MGSEACFLLLVMRTINFVLLPKGAVVVLEEV